MEWSRAGIGMETPTWFLLYPARLFCFERRMKSVRLANYLHQSANAYHPEIREEKQAALPRSIHLSTFCKRSLVCSVAVSVARKRLSGCRPLVKARYGTADVRGVHRNGKQRLVDRHQLPLARFNRCPCALSAVSRSLSVPLLR